MRFVLILLLAIAAASVVLAHNVTLGYRGPNDIHLHRQFAKLHSKLLRKVKLDVLYPTSGVQYRTITYINIVDLKKKGSEGSATVIAGGIGLNSTKIHLKSQRNKGLHFMVDIYGY